MRLCVALAIIMGLPSYSPRVVTELFQPQGGRPENLSSSPAAYPVPNVTSFHLCCHRRISEALLQCLEGL